MQPDTGKYGSTPVVGEALFQNNVMLSYPMKENSISNFKTKQLDTIFYQPYQFSPNQGHQLGI